MNIASILVITSTLMWEKIRPPARLILAYILCIGVTRKKAMEGTSYDCARRMDVGGFHRWIAGLHCGRALWHLKIQVLTKDSSFNEVLILGYYIHIGMQPHIG
jgi:hypothetical protein